jgi:hypothetical protein
MTHSLSAREECRLRVSENGMSRSTYAQKEEKVTKDWSELHNEEVYKFYSSANIIRMIKPELMGWERHLART